MRSHRHVLARAKRTEAAAARHRCQQSAHLQPDPGSHRPLTAARSRKERVKLKASNDLAAIELSPKIEHDMRTLSLSLRRCMIRKTAIKDFEQVMWIRRHIQRTWTSALSALLSLVIAVAPIAALIVMSAHAHAASFDAALPHHGHEHRGSVGGHGHADHATNEHDHVGNNAPGHHRHDAAGVEAAEAQSPAGQHDHGGGTDDGCCGTFCHSAMALLAAPQMPEFVTRASYGWSTMQQLAAVDPDLPQRPPSSSLSP